MMWYDMTSVSLRSFPFRTSVPNRARFFQPCQVKNISKHNSALSEGANYFGRNMGDDGICRGRACWGLPSRFMAIEASLQNICNWNEGHDFRIFSKMTTCTCKIQHDSHAWIEWLSIYNSDWKTYSIGISIWTKYHNDKTVSHLSGRSIETRLSRPEP